MTYDEWREQYSPQDMFNEAMAKAAWGAAADEMARLRGIVPEVLERLNDELCSENEVLRAEAASFHVAYRMKCDEETKVQAVEIERLRADRDCEKRLRKDSDDLATELRIALVRIALDAATAQAQAGSAAPSMSAELLNALLCRMQADSVRYLVPDNDCGADWFVNRMLWHLDEPEQRAAQGAAPSLLSIAQTDASSGDPGLF